MRTKCIVWGVALSGFVLLTLVKSSYGLAYIGVSYPAAFGYTDLTKEEKPLFKLDKNTGFGLDLAFPFGMVVRYDQYVQTYKPIILNSGDTPNKAKNTIQIVSLGFRYNAVSLPVHFSETFGAGTDTFTSFDGSTKFKTKTPYQIYLEAGVSVLPVFDIFASVAYIYGNTIPGTYSANGANNDISSKMSAWVASLGLHFGFSTGGLGPNP